MCMTDRATGKTAWDKERTHELFRRYKEEGDMDAREKLVMSHLNLVRFLANKFKNRGEPIDDLMQVGYLGLLKAIDRFDPARGLEFTTYATPTIMGEIKRHFRDKGWSVRVPRRLQELSAKVNQATDELTTELQRSPTVEEIARYLDVTVDEVLEAMESSSAYSSVPLEAPGCRPIPTTLRPCSTAMPPRTASLRSPMTAWSSRRRLRASLRVSARSSSSGSSRA